MSLWLLLRRRVAWAILNRGPRRAPSIGGTRARTCRRGRKGDPFCTFHVLVRTRDTRKRNSLNRAVNIYACAYSSSRSLTDGRANGLDRRAAFLPRLSKRHNYISLYFNFRGILESTHIYENSEILKLLILNNLFRRLNSISLEAITLEIAFEFINNNDNPRLYTILSNDHI